MMKKLKPDDRIHLSGGYDQEPRWLNDGNGYGAVVLRFFDNKIEGRSGDERLSVAIEFDDVLEFEGVKGKFGVLLGRWQDQKWITKGVSHVHLTDRDVSSEEEFEAAESVWMESHASYEKV